MKKHELLVPAGNMECLYQAVQNGCDAVYIACKTFGARKFAQNFSNEEIVEAIKYCHLYGVKVYVTMNTIVKNNEVDDFLKQALFLHQNGVDALIVQDFGMICYLREKYPNLEIHASTQANICSKDVCLLYHRLGVKRVVFARELSLEECEAIDVPIEKEIFIHGALCISYSGYCLMSSMLGGRSGNRGECAGVCRMPFSLKKENSILQKNRYLLSTKELNTTGYFASLINSNIDSFKIEGRMKGPLYVGFITRLYRRLLDGEDVDLSVEMDSLKTIFNRDFTKGRLFLASDMEMMNQDSPNHRGLRIGKVVKVVGDKVCIQLDKGKSLHQHDAIRFQTDGEGFIVNYLYDKNMKLINASDDNCYVGHSSVLKKGDIVYKTQDSLLQKEYINLAKRKVNVCFTVRAFIGEALQVEIHDEANSFIEQGIIVEKSMNAPISKESIMKQLGKLGDSPFTCISFDIKMDDDIFIPIKQLNEIRRKLVEKLENCRRNVKKELIEKVVSFDYYEMSVNESSSAFVYNEEQYLACRSLIDGNLYTNDLKLWKKHHELDDKIYYSPKRCSYVRNIYFPSLISDYSLSYDSSVGNYTLNVMNIYSAYYLRKMGLSTITLSVELTKGELAEFVSLFYEKFGGMNFEILVYGKVENMIIKGNILQLEANCFQYSLIDSKKREFPVYYDGIDTHILNYENINYNDLTFSSYHKRFDFYQETGEEIIKIVKQYD